MASKALMLHERQARLEDRARVDTALTAFPCATRLEPREAGSHASSYFMRIIGTICCRRDDARTESKTLLLRETTPPRGSHGIDIHMNAITFC